MLDIYENSDPLNEFLTVLNDEDCIWELEREYDGLEVTEDESG